MSDVRDQTGEVRSAAVTWRWAVFGGAVVGGVFWGVVAALTVGAAGDAARHAVQDGHRLVLAAGVTAACLAVGGLLLALVRRRTTRGSRLVRSLAVAVVIGPLGGWLVVASLAVQAAMRGWG